MPRNYAEDWRKDVNFKEIPYDDYISKYYNYANVYFSEKVDGILGALVYEEGKECYLITRHGIVIRDIPLLDEYKNILDRMNFKSIIIIGDLVAVKNNKILPFNQTSSIVRTGEKSYEKSKLIKHYIYDIFTINGSRVSYKKACKILESFGKLRTEFISFPEHKIGGGDELEVLWKKTRNEVGFDGVVARLDNGKVFKIKHSFTVDLCVIGAGHKSMKSWKRNQISYLILAFMDERGKFRRSSNVGTGFTNKLRSDLFEYVKNFKIGEDVGEIFVKPERAIEVEYREANIKTMPVYEFKDNNYIYLGDHPSITLRHPSFNRFRPDKGINPNDLRMEQIPL